METVKSPIALDWEDSGFFTLDDEAFSPRIFEVSVLGEKVPEGFNAVSLSLDGKVGSDLEWGEVQSAAHAYAEEGYYLFWQMDLGLFEQLKRPLSDTTQFNSVAFSLQHFSEGIWKEFCDKTLGIGLYCGDAELTRNFSWDHEQLTHLQGWVQERFESTVQLSDAMELKLDSWDKLSPDGLSKSLRGLQLLRLFCRDAFVDYLDLLTTRLPVSLQAFAFFDVSKLVSSAEILTLFNPESFEHLRCAIKGNLEQIPALAWGEGKSSVGSISREPLELLNESDRSIGICLPPVETASSVFTSRLTEIIENLESKNLSFRVIPETLLTMQWNGLDYLVVDSSSVSDLGLRKLQGFCAAGGVVATLGEKLDLAQEISLEELV
ncbi:MAG: hypothetical protein ACI8RA_001160 [Chlamydiales bacterium]|jgi:hypothetical protein